MRFIVAPRRRNIGEYGAVTIEVFGRLGFALTDAEPMFEALLAEMGGQLMTPPAA